MEQIAVFRSDVSDGVIVVLREVIVVVGYELILPPSPNEMPPEPTTISLLSVVFPI
jgi:hypothetical protein